MTNSKRHSIKTLAKLLLVGFLIAGLLFGGHNVEASTLHEL